ncbi:MAG: fimbrillin family protein [Muribaculaceae bacterium]|nr:fimbrillin family protein [Muribaculaceae bacterium]
MKLHKIKYIPFICGGMLLTGCADEELIGGGTSGANPDTVSFEAFAMRGNSGSVTRSGEDTPLEPLLLEGGEETLYLHSYVSDRVGYIPGEDSGIETRGVEITNSDLLRRYHGNFTVLANLSDSERYFGWSEVSKEEVSDLWRTSRTEYWPASRPLDFYAISPASEYSSLETLSAQGGKISFSYEAKRGESGRDADAQTDLLLSIARCDKGSSRNGSAPLEFHHALSAVKFAIRDVANGEIESITISGVKSAGVCIFDSTGATEWSDHSGTGSYTQNFNYKVNGLGAVDPSEENADILLTASMPEKTFMLIPQQIPDEAEIIAVVKRTGMTPERLELRGKIKANSVDEWKPGHEYVYTLSSSSSNWVYVLQAYGNHQSESPSGQHDVSKGNIIYSYSPAYALLDEGGRVTGYPYDTYGDNASFYVRSYRYHANDQKKVEDVSWVASHGAGKQYRVPTSDSELYEAGRDLPAEEWIPAQDILKGNGSSTLAGEKREITFASHHQVTDWPGDQWMQDQNPYPGNSEGSPWDLSTCGGNNPMNTANTYVIDREGWYCFPLVYGNAIKNGNKNPAAYEYQGTLDGTHINLKNHAGNDIADPWISVRAKYTVSVVWADVFNAVATNDVSLVKIGGKDYIKFHANKHNMQQGSVIIGLYNGSGNAVWSWHIWITEHWLDHSTGMPHAFKGDTGKFSGYESSKTGWRMRGDLLIDNQHVGSSYRFQMAPYNLGWCDPKDVDYLRRRSEMKFTQYGPDGKPTGKTAVLPILQDGSRVSFLYGNNTYYQWGRKDPIVGFRDHTQTVKRNYGDKKYDVRSEVNGVSLATAIKNPHVMYKNSQDWCSKSYHNLWNNSTNDLKGIKTVYDPSPPGYMVPPSDVFKFVGPHENGRFDHIISDDKTLKNFNGTKVDDFTFRACVKNKNSVTQTDRNSIWLTSTGNRWWRDGDDFNGREFKGGDNFNAQIVYLWSSSKSSNYDYEAHGLSLGLDNDNNKDHNYNICAYFKGRRSMARPVRSIREF